MKGHAKKTWTAIVAAIALLGLTYCSGFDPQPIEQCRKDEDCAASQRCELPTKTCVARDESHVIVLGQPDEHSVVENELGMGQPVGVAISPTGRLFVADYNNFRLLIYNTIPQQAQTRPDVVVGQPDVKSGAEAPVSEKSLYYGYYCGAPIAVSGDKLFVAEASRHRAMIWNALPTTNSVAANVVVGQSTFTNIGIDGGVLPPAKATLANPCGIASDGTRLFIADHSNHRILIWNTIPTSNATPADIVLGQPDFTSSAYRCPLAQNSSKPKNCLNAPSSVFHDGSRLWVADNSHNRVLMWKEPINLDKPADIALSAGGVGGLALNGPRSAFTSANRLFVADQNNNRVLIWKQIPDADDVGADVVLGQPDMQSVAPFHGGAGPDERSLVKPASVTSDGTHVVVADTGSNRVLVWNSIPSQSYAPADVVVGLPSMTAREVRPPSATTFDIGSTFASTDGKRFMVGSASRILLWDHVPTGPNDPATSVLGQNDFTTVSPDPLPTDEPQPWSATRFHVITGLWSDETHLVAADTFKHRVLVWTKPITAIGQAADIVLGQASFNTNVVATNGPPSATSVRNPTGIVSDGSRLAIADTSNHRVLLWNTFPTKVQQPADLVLGQATLDAGEPNRGLNADRNTLRRPNSLAWDGTHFFVVDTFNHRVLVWNGWPSANGQPADVVIGQPDFTGTAANNGGRSAQTLSYPGGVLVTGGRLYIGDQKNERVLRWDTIPTANYQPASAVYGQKTFDTAERNQGGVGPRSLGDPALAAASLGRIWVMDAANHRLVGLPAP